MDTKGSIGRVRAKRSCPICAVIRQQDCVSGHVGDGLNNALKAHNILHEVIAVEVLRSLVFYSNSQEG